MNRYEDLEPDVRAILDTDPRFADYRARRRKDAEDRAASEARLAAYEKSEAERVKTVTGDGKLGWREIRWILQIIAIIAGSILYGMLA